jgi:hypothetical protein
MKHHLAAISLVLIAFECVPEEGDLPHFVPNSNRSNIPNEIKGYIHSFDFSVVFFGNANLRKGTQFKIFGVTGGNWKKIELKNNVIEKDTLYDNLWTSSIVRIKNCKGKEANAFLKRLNDLKAFDIQEENAILEKCKLSIKKDFVPDITDGPTLSIILVSGNEVRSLRFYNPSGRAQICPEVDEWGLFNRVAKII